MKGLLCSRCGQRRMRVFHVPLPLSEDIVALCSRCLVPAFLARMGGLIAHG